MFLPPFFTISLCQTLLIIDKIPDRKSADDLRIVRTLAVGYKREFNHRFGFSPEVGHQSPVPAAGFQRTDQQYGY